MKRIVAAFTLLSCIAFLVPAHAVTPRKPNAKLFATAPEECLFFFHNFGFTETDPNSKNKTEQLMLEPSVKAFIGEMKSLVDQGMTAFKKTAPGPDQAKAVQDVFDLGKLLLDRPFTMYLQDVEMGQFGPMINAGLVVDGGEKVGEIEKRLLEFQGMIPPDAVTKETVSGIKCNCISPPGPDAPVFHWGKVGSYIVVSIGNQEEPEAAMESLMANVKAPAPEWLKPALKRIDVPRRWSFSYVNVEKITSLIAEQAPPEVRNVIDVTGLGDIATISGAVGLDNEGMLQRSLIEATKDTGILGLFDRNGVTIDDMKEVPRDSISAMAMRMDPEKIMELILNLSVQIDPEEGVEVQEQIDALSEGIGLDIRKDICASLGDRWLIYSRAGAGGGAGAMAMIPDIVVSVDVRDASGIQKGLNLLKKTVNEQGGEQISVADTTVGDRSAYYLKGAPVAPAWCLTKDRLVIAMQKASIIKLLDSPPAIDESLASEPRVKQMFAKFPKPVMFNFNDGKTGLTQMYQFIPMMMNMAAGPMEDMGIEFDVTNMPPIEDIVKHIDSSVGVLNRSEDGLEMVSRQTLPSISGLVVGAAVGLGLPAVQAGRGAAQRAHSVNNLRQLGLACLNFESATQRFPAQKIGKDGKNGLSWRVAILPYIEEGALYEKFHLDEPWDSEHNLKLAKEMPDVFRSPQSNAEKGKTNYLAVSRADSILTGEGKGIKFGDVTDGSSKTILIVEADDERAVIWTKPDDFEWDEDDPTDGLGNMRPKGGWLALFADGHVATISDQEDEDDIKAMFTRNGGETIEP